MTGISKYLLITFLFLFPHKSLAQNNIDWDGIYLLVLTDFQSAASQIGDVTIYSLNTAATIDFAFQMTNGEFMFTKNFNSKVGCTFHKNAASLVAPDTLTAMDLLNFARFDFDLTELYARKFRKKLYESKGAFSDASFFRPIFDTIQKEYSERHTLAARDTDIGRESLKLVILHDAVRAEIAELSEFCKSCKPVKKKK